MRAIFRRRWRQQYVRRRKWIGTAVTGDATVLAQTINVTTTVPAPVVSTGVTVTPATVNAVTTLPAPTVIAGFNTTVTPPTINVTVTVPRPQIAAPVAWFDGITFSVEAALTAAIGTYGVWDSGLWDTATWGPDLIWTDISQWVRKIDVDRKFSRDLSAWESGTATLTLDNRDGRFSPNNLSGPYVSGGVTQVRPWRPVRIRVTYAGTTYHLYRGYALAWEESFPGKAGRPGDAVVTVPCTDELARLAAVDGLAGNEVGGGETSGMRIHRVLDAAGHTGERAIDTGRTTMQPTTLAQNAVAELKLAADSEGGALYVETDSTVVFENQYALIENSRSSTIQATFGDGGGAELPYYDVTTAYNGDLVTNIASFARANGTAQTITDNTSRALYGDRRETRTDLMCESDAQASGLAQWWIARYKDPELRITQMVLKPRLSPSTLYPQILSRRVRDLIRVINRPPGTHTIDRNVHVAGVHHAITTDDWTVAYDLWSATPYAAFTTSQWNSGVWDTAIWFY